MLHSIYDLTTFCRRTAGHVPAKLVGASTTVVGSKMYLFGGRLVSERKMVADLYVFDLRTFKWEKIPPHPEDDTPRPRYFHSTDSWNNHLIVFGGMSNQPDSQNPDELCVLNDVRFFDLATRRWLPPNSTPLLPDSLVPRARYAHLSSVAADRLFIIGGQDFHNNWLDDICVYDLLGKTWVQRREYPRHCGTYRSVAVASNMTVRIPQDESSTSQASSTLGPLGERFKPETSSLNTAGHFTPSENLIHLPYSAPPTEEHPSDIYLYSNYNFTDVRRELEVFSPLPDTDFTIHDRSSSMTGTTFPPGLRFPTGAILGTNLIIAGTYLAHSFQSFSIWSLDLLTMSWSRIDPGRATESGSWFRGCLCAEENKFLIFGNKNGNLVEDYNRRLLSWDHVAVVDLESFGIYQPPSLKLDIRMQELGLAALEEKMFMDFEIVCDDGRKISCSRKLLEERWSWFKKKRGEFEKKAKEVLLTLPSSNMHVPLPELATSNTTSTLFNATSPVSSDGAAPADWELVNGVSGIGELMINGMGHSPTLNGTTINGDSSPQQSPIDAHYTIPVLNGSGHPSAISKLGPPSFATPTTGSSTPLSASTSATLPALSSATSMTIVDPRLTPRQLVLSESYPIALALIQYFHTLSLITPLQHAPAVLSQLLVLSTNYQVEHLRELVKHAMHRALSNSTSVGVYEITSLCNCRSLQIRALRTIMSYTQRRPGRSRGDSNRNEQGGGGSGSGNGGKDAGGGARNSGSGLNGPPGASPTSPGPPGALGDRYARPRGTSDARWRGAGAGGPAMAVTTDHEVPANFGYSADVNASITTLTTLGGATTVAGSSANLSSGSHTSGSPSATSPVSASKPSSGTGKSKVRDSAKAGIGYNAPAQQIQPHPSHQNHGLHSRASTIYSPYSPIHGQNQVQTPPHSAQPSPTIPYHEPSRALAAALTHRPSLVHMNSLSSVDEMFERNSSSGHEGSNDGNTDTEDEHERDIRASLLGGYRSRYDHTPTDDHRRVGSGSNPSIGGLSRKSSATFGYESRDSRDESQVVGNPQPPSNLQVQAQAQAQAVYPPPMLRSNSDYTGSAPPVRPSRSASASQVGSVFKPQLTTMQPPASSTVLRSPITPNSVMGSGTNNSSSRSGPGFRLSLRPVFTRQSHSQSPLEHSSIPPSAASFGFPSSVSTPLSASAPISYPFNSVTAATSTAPIFTSASAHTSHDSLSNSTSMTRPIHVPSSLPSLSSSTPIPYSQPPPSTSHDLNDLNVSAEASGAGAKALSIIHEAGEEREKQTISEMTMTKAGMTTTIEEYTSYFDDDGDETGAEGDLDTEAEAELEYNSHPRQQFDNGRRGAQDAKPNSAFSRVAGSEWWGNSAGNDMSSGLELTHDQRAGAYPYAANATKLPPVSSHGQPTHFTALPNSVPPTPPALSRAPSVTATRSVRNSSIPSTPNPKSPKDVEFSMALSAAIKEIGGTTPGQSGSTLSRFLSRRRKDAS